MQVHITQINRKERVSKKTGKPFTSLGLQTQEYKERWLSGFNNSTTANWKVGDVVEIEVKDDGTYLNFEVPRKDSGPAAKDAAYFELKNILILKILPLLQEIHDRLPAKPEEDDDYPAMDETNDAHGVDSPF